jgi:hypothetical protein
MASIGLELMRSILTGIAFGLVLGGAAMAAIREASGRLSSRRADANTDGTSSIRRQAA